MEMEIDFSTNNGQQRKRHHIDMSTTEDEPLIKKAKEADESVRPSDVPLDDGYSSFDSKENSHVEMEDSIMDTSIDTKENMESESLISNGMKRVEEKSNLLDMVQKEMIPESEPIFQYRAGQTTYCTSQHQRVFYNGKDRWSLLWY